jgi:hypothetical protein
MIEGEDEFIISTYTYPLQSWPWFINPSAKDTVEKCATIVPSLLYKAIQLEFGKDHTEFSKFYFFPEVLSHLFLETGIDTRCLMQRTDATWTEEGLKIIELNVGSNIGGWQIQWMDAPYRKQKELIPFFESTPCNTRHIPRGLMRYLINGVKQKGLARDRIINVLFVCVDEEIDIRTRNTLSEFFNLELEGSGYNGFLNFTMDYEELTFKDDEVFFDNKRIDVVLSIDITGLESPTELYRSCIANKVLWPDNPLDGIIGDKRNLALLYKHKDSGVFSQMERQIINAYIPWCATIKCQKVDYRGQNYDLKTLLQSQKDQFVIKTALGGQGVDVFVGRSQTEDEWLEIIEKSFSESGWVVQEFCKSLNFYGQFGQYGIAEFDVIWGIFGFGDEYAGSWLRMMDISSEHGVINSATGAEEAIVYEVAE